jgi:hypothetical protein
MSHRRDKTRALTIPRMPRPASGIDEIYVDQLVDALETALDVLQGQQFRTFSEINLSDLQSHGAGLRVGDVYEDSGILKIALAGVAYAAPFGMTMSLGGVTVSTP